MERRFWDISVPLRTGVPAWPGSRGFDRRLAKDIAAGDAVNDSDLVLNAHFGTHIDAPLHHLSEGAPVDELALEDLVGPATVIQVEGVTEITAAALEAQDIPPTATRLLIRTDNSCLWQQPAFDKDYVALSVDAAQWLVRRGIRLVGVDYLSVEKYGGDGEVHRILLGAGIVAVEGLDLTDVEPGEYALMCLPLRIVGAEGAPARAVLMRYEMRREAA